MTASDSVVVQIIAKVTAAAVPDGLGAMSTGTQDLTVTADFPVGTIGPVVVPGGSRPAAADIATAINTLAGNLAAVLGNASNLAIMSSWGVSASISEASAGGGGIVANSFRDPGASDDSAAGYGIGYLWNNQTTGKQFSATSVAVGAAVWTPLASAAAQIVDAVGGVAPATCYGTLLLKSNYAGKAINVIRASDGTTTDIGFVNGKLDTAALDAFLSGTTGKVVTLYDQSGGGFNATQTNDANRPSIGTTVIGGHRCISFDGSIANVNKFFTLPAGVALERSTLSTFAIGEPHGAQTRTGFFEFGSNISTFWNEGEQIVSGAGTTTVYGLQTTTGALFSSLIEPENGPVLMGMISSLAASTIYHNEQSAAFGPATAQAITGGIIGSLDVNSTFWGDWDALAFVFWSRTLSAAEFTRLKQSAYAAVPISPQYNDRIIAVGDSITYGITLGSNNSYVRQMSPQLKRPAQIYNAGIPSATLAQMNTNFATLTTPLIDATKRSNTLIVAAGRNDIALNADSGAAAYARLVTFTSNARSAASVAGAPLKIIWSTLLPSVSLGETDRSAFNNLARANWRGLADGLADWGSDATIGIAGANTNETCYNSDHIHPNAAGAAIMAPYAAQAVNSVLP